MTYFITKARCLAKALAVLALLIPSIFATVIPAYAGPETFSKYTSESEIVVDHTVWAEFLTKYVALGEAGVNLVAYKVVTEEDRAALQTYITTLADIEPGALSEDEAFAYWVNLYNAVTVDVILENYPVKSIRDIKSGFRAGPWNRNLVTVQDEALSLNDIEHQILRKYWRDPRIHYAVNCASFGCPNLATEPFTAASLDVQLDTAAVAYINHSRGVMIENGRLKLSSIFKWYRKDFGKNDKEVIAHLREYAAPELSEKLSSFTRISSYDYDWSLNSQK